MKYQFTMDKPLYLQLIDIMKEQIATGQLMPGAKLESSALLAQHYGTNENTVKRALKELEHEGLAVSDKDGECFVTLATPRIDGLRSSLLRDEAHTFVSAAQGLGISFDDAMRILDLEWKDQLVTTY